MSHFTLRNQAGTIIAEIPVSRKPRHTPWQTAAAIGEPGKVIEIQPVEVPIPKKDPAPAPAEKEPVKEPVGR